MLEINGKGPRDWPLPGWTPTRVPTWSRVSYRDLEHKKPWGVTTIEVASYADRYRGAYSGKWASLSPSGRRGREIWINSCASCHQGPEGTFGGIKAGRPFPVIAAYAGYDRPYFVKYVRNPRSLVPCAMMEPHPRYTDAELSDLIEFITAGQP